MKCPECGYLLPDDSDFCQYCGKKLVIPAKEAVPQMASVAAWSAPVDGSTGISQTTSQRMSCKQCFCKRCGGAIDSHTKKCSSCGKQYFKLSIKPVVLLIIVLFVAAAGYIGYNYFKAIDSMNDQEFIASKRYFDNLFVSDRLFKDEYAYVEAGILMEEGKYVEALQAFQELDIPVPSSITDDLKSKIYEEGQAAYRNGEISQAETCFAVLNGYERSADYLVLISCKVDSFPNGVEIRNHYNALIDLLGFEDANEIMLANEVLSHRFLKGGWVDGPSYDRYFLIMAGVDYETLSNLPHKKGVGYYSLSDGIYYMGETEYTAVKCYRFKIIDKDTLSVYCYEDGSTYTLYRHKEGA